MADEQPIMVEYTMKVQGQTIYGPQVVDLATAATAPIQQLFKDDEEIIDLQYTRVGKRSGEVFVSRFKRVSE